MPKESFEQLAEKVISLLESQEEIVDFLRPVEWKKLGLYDYPKIIKHPMSILNIRRKLKNSQYSSFDQVIKDLNLIWNNCREYNQENSAIVINANKLEACCKAFCKENISLPQKRKKPESDSGDSETEKPENVSEKVVNDEEEKLVFKEVKIEELVILKEKVMEASLDTLAKILALVRKRCEKSITQKGDNVVVALEKLSYETFQQICSLVNEVPSLSENQRD